LVASYDRMRRVQTFGSSASSPKRSTTSREPAVGLDTEAGPFKLADRLLVRVIDELVLAPPTLREETPLEPGVLVPHAARQDLWHPRERDALHHGAALEDTPSA
jgi:hypothetical protein